MTVALIWAQAHHGVIGAGGGLPWHLPEDLDRILHTFGLSLFPSSLADLVLDCDCPGWQKPCRHLTAACYVLAESFDADPFGILAWRGRGREELLDGLRAQGLQTFPGDPELDAVRRGRAEGIAISDELAGRLDALAIQMDVLPLSMSQG